MNSNIIQKLPEKWCIKINQNNQETIKHFLNNCGCGFYIDQYLYFLNKIPNQFEKYQNYTWNMYSPDKIPVNNTYKDCEDSLEITFDQFKKYVLKSEELSPIQLSNIEHPELSIIEESLLEKAKRLYPIGTVVKSVCVYDLKTIKTNDFKETIHTYIGKVIYADDGNIAIYSEQNNKWAEIIEYPHGFKIGDKIKLKFYNIHNIYTITNIKDDVLFYDEISFINKNHSRVLAKNAIKV